MTEQVPRLFEILKTLGDNTRYAIYLELARSPWDLSTSEVAASLGLHANTVRPHLERMRDVGLVDVRIDADGSVGRPVHRYRLAADAPSLGLEPPAFPVLAQMLTDLARRIGADQRTATETGRDHAAGVVCGGGTVAAVDARLGELGFDPATVTDESGSTIAFTNCPYAALADAAPEVICGLHRGIVEGMLAGTDHRVTEFRTVVDRDPCRVTIRAVGA